MLKQSNQNQKEARIMLNYIEDKEDKIMEISASAFFNNLSDKDFIKLAEMGKLKDICSALSVDLHSNNTSEFEC